MTTESRYPDPETMAQQLLGSLFVQIEQLHRQRGDRGRFAVEPGSSLAGDDQATRRISFRTPPLPRWATPLSTCTPSVR